MKLLCKHQYRNSIVLSALLAAFLFSACSLHFAHAQADSSAGDGSSGAVTPPPESSTGTGVASEPTPIPLLPALGSSTPPPSTPVSPTPPPASATSATSPKPSSTNPKPTSSPPAPSVTSATAPVLLAADDTATAAIPTNSGPGLLPIVLAVGAGLCAGAYVMLRAKKQNKKKNNPCDEIKKQLEAKKGESDATNTSLSLQERVVEELKRKAEDKKDELQEKAIIKAKDVTKEKVLKLEAESLASKGIDLAERASETYEMLNEKYEQAQEVLAALRNTAKGQMTEIDRLESAYTTCMAGVVARGGASAGGIEVPHLEGKSKRIYITGVQGTGKTAIGNELKKRGYVVFDTDTVPDLSGWKNKLTGEKNRVHPGPRESRNITHIWHCDPKKLEEMLDAEGGKPVVVVGISENQDEYLKLFDKVFLLQCPEKTMLERITTRTDHDFGKHPAEKEYILGFYKDFQKKFLAQGATPVDSSGSIESVADALVKEIE